jgi:CRISPR-associated protein Cmr4
MRLYWLHCLTPTHVGTGRASATSTCRSTASRSPTGRPCPVRPSRASGRIITTTRGIKLDDRKERPKLKAAFGLADQEAAGDSSQAGALIPTDARLVCLPVRSFKGTFAWCTSRLALSLLHRDLSMAPFTDFPDLPGDVPENHVHLPATSALKDGEHVYFEDLDFKAESAETVGKWAQWIAQRVFPGAQASSWQGEFEKRFAVLPDVVFDYLTETATEVVTRVRIDDDTKTVAEGQLWTESLCRPSRSLPVWCRATGFTTAKGPSLRRICWKRTPATR